MFIFGTDYSTPDGTALRDYIHVEDLASAHLAALDYLRDGGESVTLNCGYGYGYSVREVIAAIEKAHGAPLPVEEAPRRAGDPPILIAGADKIQDVLDWKPQFEDINLIVSSQLAWEKKLMENPELLDNTID
jgi:UDP-glucose 4-epimerase